jgi:hypothetical protein
LTHENRKPAAEAAGFLFSIWFLSVIFFAGLLDRELMQGIFKCNFAVHHRLYPN